jgi:hypothetical protein
MKRIAQFREQIDACRPGSDDLALPALAPLAQAAESERAVAAELDRSQQFDRVVMSVLHDVPVPGDLLERLLAQATQGKSAEQHDVVAISDGSANSIAPTPASGTATGRRTSRRWLMAGTGLAALAASLVGLGVFLSRPARDISQAELADAATDWYTDAWRQSAEWQPYAGTLPPHSALRVRPMRTLTMNTEFGAATVYDCSVRDRPAAFIAIRTRDRFMNLAPLPFTPVKGATGGLAIGAWQSGGTLYVLVLDKDGLRLDDMLRRPNAA